MTDKQKQGRGPDKQPRKLRPSNGLTKLVGIRLPQYVVDYFGGSSTKMRAALELYIRADKNYTGPFDNV